MYQSVLVQHAESCRYHAGQEEFTVHVLSSRHADEGVPTVLLERQDNPAASLAPAGGLREELCRMARQVRAYWRAPMPTRPAGNAAAPAAGGSLDDWATGT